MEDQIRQMWATLMRQMTAGGATRDEIADMAMATAGTILGLTIDTLWPAAGGSRTVHLSETRRYVRMTGAWVWVDPGEGVLSSAPMETNPNPDRPTAA